MKTHSPTEIEKKQFKKLTILQPDFVVDAEHTPIWCTSRRSYDAYIEREEKKTAEARKAADYPVSK